jgi:hypothetical protein
VCCPVHVERLLPRNTRADLRKAMYGRIVVRMELIGRYKWK